MNITQCVYNNNLTHLSKCLIESVVNHFHTKNELFDDGTFYAQDVNFTVVAVRGPIGTFSAGASRVFTITISKAEGGLSIMSIVTAMD